jgi:chemotaxis signal transduction protein
MHVVFTVAGRELVASLVHVREVVRGASLERLPGCEQPFVGALQLRGVTVPVADARPVVETSRGDVILVLEPGRGPLGVVVDRVVAVTDEAALGVLTPAPEGLPPYVQGLLERDGVVRPMVDLRALAVSAATARAQMYAAGLAGATT